MFFVVGVPLFPIESFYATSDTGAGLQGVSIELHITSVLAGYVRVAAGLGAVFAGIFGYLESDGFLLLLAAVATTVWVGSMWWLGRLGEGEQARRRRLRSVVGIGAPPELLSANTRDGLTASMVQRWSEATGGTDWRARLMSAEAGPAEVALLWALAEYNLDRELATFADQLLKSSTPKSDLFSGVAG